MVYDFAIYRSFRKAPQRKRQSRGRDAAKEESFQVQFHEDPEMLHYVGDLPIGLDENET